MTDNYSTTERDDWAAGQHHEAPSSRAAQPEKVQPRVYIVLLNWNGWRDTVECMRSLENLEYRNWQALIVDNGSTDDSVEQLRRAFPQASILESPANLGFARGNNLGIRAALENAADYVFVLNNDTTVAPDAISQFIEFAEQHPDAALMGPKIDRRNPQREWAIRRKMDLLTLLCTFTALRRLIARMPLLRRIFYCVDKGPAVTQFLPGSALFFRAAAFKQVGLFDESTFLDFEELIMAEKVRRAGFEAYFVPQARIWHKGSASAAHLRAKRYIENAKSEEYFFTHYVRLSRFGRWTVRLIRFFTYAARALRYRNYREHFDEFVKALRPRHSVEVG